MSKQYLESLFEVENYKENEIMLEYIKREYPQVYDEAESYFINLDEFTY